MKRSDACFQVSVVVIALFSCPNTKVVRAHDDAIPQADTLSDFMSSLVVDGQVSGGVTVLEHKGKLVHLKAVGFADREEGRRMKPDAIFRIASMTKPITTVAVMMLYEEGKLSLDDPVSKWIDAFASPKVVVSTDPSKTEPAKSEITIKQLLTHTSGLGYTTSPVVGQLYLDAGLVNGVCTTELSLEEHVNRLATLPLAFQPGARFMYGASTDVLGLVVEKETGLSLDDFVRRRICLPLKMNDTYFKIPDSKKNRLVAAYIPEKNGLKRLPDGKSFDYVDNGGITRLSADYPTNEKHRCFYGGGGLCSTASDYLRFCRMLLNEGELDGVRLLEPETVRLMTSNQISGVDGFMLDGGFGLGFHVISDSIEVDKQLRGAYAWFGFWSTSFRISPKGEWILITLSQTAWNEKTVGSFQEFEKLACEALER